MKYGGAFHQPLSMFDVIRTALRAPEASWPDAIAFVRGTAMSAGALWPSMQSLDARRAYPRIEAPVFFLLGRHDRQVSAELAAEYFERLEAPYKELVWFEDSAHAPPFEEPEKFNAEIVRIAREIGLLQPIQQPNQVERSAH